MLIMFGLDYNFINFIFLRIYIEIHSLSIFLYIFIDKFVNILSQPKLLIIDFVYQRHYNSVQNTNCIMKRVYFIFYWLTDMSTKAL